MTADASEKRTPYFSSEEQKLILMKYEEEKGNLTEKSNTVAASKRRQMAWQRIADCVNACNPSGVKRTWEQIKTKHKNIISSANKKKNLQRQTGVRGPAPEYTPVEELALANNKGRPIMDGVEGGVSSNPGARSSKYVEIDGDTVMVVVPEVLPSDPVSLTEVVDLGDDETLSMSSERAVEEETHPPPAEPQASTSTGSRPMPFKKSAADPVRALYKRKLEQDIKYRGLKMKKMELEIEYLHLKIRKLKGEVQGLRAQQGQGKENV